MANVNRVMLIGRLTNKPEVRAFSSGGKVANFRFAVNNRKRDQTSGEWVDDPCFLDVKAYNRETGRKLADLVEQYLDSGHLAYIEGHLVMETWNDKESGQKRSKLVIVLDDLQFLQPKSGTTSGAGAPSAGLRSPQTSGARGSFGRPSQPQNDFNESPVDEPMLDAGGQDDIPF